MGTRSAYYGVRAAHSLTNLARRLKSSATIIWKVSRTIMKLTNFMAKNMKKIIMASNSVDIMRMLPLLPPVVLGVYVMFGVFWPSRVVFFTAKQRQNHMSERFMRWTLALIVLVVAVLINTVLLDELVSLLGASSSDVFTNLEFRIYKFFQPIFLNISFSTGKLRKTCFAPIIICS